MLNVQVSKASLRCAPDTCIHKHLLLKSDDFMQRFSVLGLKFCCFFAPVKAFAEDKCQDTCQLFSKIDLNGDNEAMVQWELKSVQG